MKTVIAGSRNIQSMHILIEALVEADFEITEVVSGGARGVDLMGEEYAKLKGIPIKRFIPDWSVGKWAGFARNKEMAKYADAAVILWDGKSRGTKNMIDNARKEGLKVFVKVEI